MRHIGGRWIEQTDENVVFDVIKLAAMAADGDDRDLLQVALRVVGHALTPLLNRLQIEDIEQEAARR